MSTDRLPIAPPPSGWLRKLFGRSGHLIPVVRMHGVITAEARPGRLSLAGIEPLLERAFRIRRAPCVALIVNSPGGSPVQSRLIAQRIRQLAVQYRKPVLVFIEDAAASGGYFIAVAGDELFADPSSIVGSIGVIFSGFGFVDAIARLGIERRLFTAGRNKATLDPFLPAKPEDIERLKQSELDIHQVFIDYVKQRRAGRLNAADDVLFTGEWWIAGRGKALGLIDELGELNTVLRARYGDDVRLRRMEPRRGLFRLPGLGMSALAGDLLNTVEERAHWARLGL